MPRLLDLFSCAGGGAMGYHRAGFDVYGVDIAPQKNYPFPHLAADAIDLMHHLLSGGSARWGEKDFFLEDFDAIHASPPCQKYTKMQRISKNAHAHEDLLTPMRVLLDETGLPYVIENVPGAPMVNYIQLCGSEFDLVAPDTDGVLLQLRRHRWFESNVFLWGAGGCRHRKGIQVASVIGHGGGWSAERKYTLGGGYTPHRKVCATLMGIDWPMNGREQSESIPPAYTEFIGKQLVDLYVPQFRHETTTGARADGEYGAVPADRR
jgi:DNA (cytosine-5)-methyltransferase 1